MSSWDQIELYDYELPRALIARRPLAKRDASRLLTLDRQCGATAHRRILDLPDLLRPGDCLVFNDSRVIPARLIGRRMATGGKWEGLYLGQTGDDLWKLIGQTRGKIRAGERIVVVPAHGNPDGRELVLSLIEPEADGIWQARCETDGDVLDLLQHFGTVPLPPYLRRKLATANDWERYQTEYARVPGSVAAPTAGLHFTAALRDACDQRGLVQAFVTLHVGIGTFRPVSGKSLSTHTMHSEWCEVSRETADRVNKTRQDGGRLIAVGTTSVRTLESAFQKGGLRPLRGETNLFIRTPYEFQVVDGLLTNFHLPRSTLFALVCAFGGIDRVQHAYTVAIQERYRFFSYGDAMLVL